MEPRVRLALVGGGRMGELHLQALRQVPAIEVRALVESDPDRRANLVGRYAIARGCAGLAEVLEDAAIEAVAISLPPACQAGAAIQVLRSGKHLFIEKPVALSLAEQQQLAAAARHSSALVQVGFHLRHHGFFQAAEQHLRGGRLGPLHVLRTVFANSSGLRPQPAWRSRLESGGGVLTNLGVHHFDLWRFLTRAQVELVQAVGSPLTTVTVQARLSNGVLASTVLSHVTADQNELELYGAQQRMRVSDYRFDGLDLQVVGEVPGGWRQRVAGLGRAVLALPERLSRGGMHQRAYQNQWLHFARCVRGAGAPQASLEDGLWASEIALAAARSLETGTPVQVGPSGAWSQG